MPDYNLLKTQRAEDFVGPFIPATILEKRINDAIAGDIDTGWAGRELKRRIGLCEQVGHVGNEMPRLDQHEGKIKSYCAFCGLDYGVSRTEKHSP